MIRRLALLALAVVLIVSGCANGYQDLHEAQAARVGTTSDINPRDPVTLRDGGNLRLALGEFPENFNGLNIDGFTEDTGMVLAPTLPGAFISQADGSQKLNTDYFTGAEVTSTNPQVVTLTINPKATWNDGTPITWEDIKALVAASSGRDKRFLVASTAGFDRIQSVTRGVDDRQAVVTFSQPYASWQWLFAAGIEPRSMTENPDVFNTRQLDAPGPSAGPYVVSTVDRLAQRIVLTRNPRWWGIKPRLDTITFMVLDDSARIPALQNNAIDAAAVSTLDDLVTAQRTPGIAIRRAPGPASYGLTFNGAAGSILADPRLRLAISSGIDRQGIVNVVQHGMTDHPVPLNNHIYLVGQQGYQDNSGPVAYNPDQARKDLDALGWHLNGSVREKDGSQLAVRYVFIDGLSERQTALVAQQNLAQIGVKLVLEPKPATDFYSEYATVGNFDIIAFDWSGSAFPLLPLTQVFTTSGDGNYGKIGNPDIDAKIAATLSELDPDKARALANQVDQMLWREGFNLPLYQFPGNVAVQSDLANYGAFGLGDVYWPAIGFTRN